MTRFSRPIAAGIGSPAFARYDTKITRVGVKVATFNVTLGALKAVYGHKAAWAAIREARRVTKRKKAT